MRIAVLITRERAIADGITSRHRYACAGANAETAATAYVEGDHDTAYRLWAQSIRLERVANELKVLEMARAA